MEENRMTLRDEGFVTSAAPLGGVSVAVVADRTDGAAALRTALAAAAGGRLVLHDGAASIDATRLEAFVNALEAGGGRAGRGPARGGGRRGEPRRRRAPGRARGRRPGGARTRARPRRGGGVGDGGIAAEARGIRPGGAVPADHHLVIAEHGAAL